MMSNDSRPVPHQGATGTKRLAAGGQRVRKGDERYLPLYEAKLFHQYDHRFATFDDADDRALLSAATHHNIATNEKADPRAVVIPRGTGFQNEKSAKGLVGPTIIAKHCQDPGNNLRNDVLFTSQLARNLALRSIVQSYLTNAAVRASAWDTGGKRFRHYILDVSSCAGTNATAHRMNEPPSYRNTRILAVSNKAPLMAVLNPRMAPTPFMEDSRLHRMNVRCRCPLYRQSGMGNFERH